MATQRIHEPDFDRLRALIKAAQGKSLRNYADRAKVNPGLLARIKNGTYTPGFTTIERLARAADPDSGVTLDDFMDAAGYPIINYAGIAKALTMFGEVAKLAEQHMVFQKKAMKAISPALSAKGIESEPDDWHNYYYIAFQPEECFIIHNQPIAQLWFFFSEAENEEDFGGFSSPEDKAAALIRQPLPIKANPERKIAVVVNSKAVYAALCGYAGHTSYRGWLSAMLIDTDNETILDEKLIASYEEGKADPLPIL